MQMDLNKGAPRKKKTMWKSNKLNTLKIKYTEITESVEKNREYSGIKDNSCCLNTIFYHFVTIKNNYLFSYLFNI